MVNDFSVQCSPKYHFVCLFLMFIFSSQGHIIKVFDNSGSIQLTKCSTWNLIFPFYILKCSCLMAEVWLKSNPNRSNIAWVSFDLQEHKSHNNSALAMDHNWVAVIFIIFDKIGSQMSDNAPSGWSPHIQYIFDRTYMALWPWFAHKVAY